MSHDHLPSLQTRNQDLGKRVEDASQLDTGLDW